LDPLFGVVKTSPQYEKLLQAWKGAR